MTRVREFKKFLAMKISWTLATAVVTPIPAFAAMNTNNNGADKLWMSIKQLTGVATIIDTGAHPDDERKQK